MENLEMFVKYAQPVVKAIKQHHNEFYHLRYYNLSAEDLFAEDGLIQFQTQQRNRPEHFSGTLPMVYAGWGEETGASLVLEISPENRKLLNPEVATTLLGEHYKLWEDGVVYLLMDHEYYQTCAGFTVTEQIDPTKGGVGNALTFLSHRLGLNYLVSHGTLLFYMVQDQI
jgi:hypothetical protein